MTNTVAFRYGQKHELGAKYTPDTALVKGKSGLARIMLVDVSSGNEVTYSGD